MASLECSAEGSFIYKNQGCLLDGDCFAFEMCSQLTRSCKRDCRDNKQITIAQDFSTHPEPPFRLQGQIAMQIGTGCIYLFHVLY